MQNLTESTCLIVNFYCLIWTVSTYFTITLKWEWYKKEKNKYYVVKGKKNFSFQWNLKNDWKS